MHMVEAVIAAVARQCMSLAFYSMLHRAMERILAAAAACRRNMYISCSKDELEDSNTNFALKGSITTYKEITVFQMVQELGIKHICVKYQTSTSFRN